MSDRSPFEEHIRNKRRKSADRKKHVHRPDESDAWREKEQAFKEDEAGREEREQTGGEW